MFVALKDLLAQSQSLTLTLTPQGARMQVIVTPKAKAGAEAGLFQPLVLSGTPEELDAEFSTAVGAFSGVRKTLVEQVEAANAAIEEAKKTAAAKAAAKTSSKPGSKPASSTTAAGKDDGSDDDVLFSDGEPESTSAPATPADDAATPATGFNIFG